MTYQILYEGSSHNALGDHRYQRVIKITDEMGLSILGPQHRADHLFGLPDVKEENSNIRAQNFGEIDSHEACFKVAALHFFNPLDMPGHLPYQGLHYRTVGYETCGDSYERNWSFAEIEKFASHIQTHGTEGIRPDSYLDYEWEKIKVLSGLRDQLEKGEAVFEKLPGTPSRIGDFNLDNPANLIFSWNYRRSWKGVCPPGMTFKKLTVGKKGNQLPTFVMETEKDGQRYTANCNTPGEPKFIPLT